MLFKFLLAIAMMICLVHTVSAGVCCSGFDTSCCGRCGDSPFIDGAECTLHGNPHDLKCGEGSCVVYNTENCDRDRGWKC
ncbi:hypothetical protein BCR42DRAFT_429203 [Absidia repens]|uniref:Uncharacterized protein n=1 Tax=Absidia repens TaxID=90262 RepID=A0A1X2HXP0_9FUNG|nr:hypothetical protein BCR42DRAFT_429203 [Absidia repens]